MTKAVAIKAREDAKAKRLAHYMIKYGDKARAARAAKVAEAELGHLLKTVAYAQNLQIEAREILYHEIFPTSLVRIKAMIEGKEKPDRTIVDLCKTVLDRVGFAAVAPQASQSADTQLEDMSIEQLRALVISIEAKRGTDAQVIPADVTQDLEFMQ